MALALANATLLEWAPARLAEASLLVDQGRIVERTASPPPHVEVLDCRGQLVVPGFVCAHTHLYSALARGMPPPATAPCTFVQILERIWWRLDRALDAEAIRLSALVGALEALRSGTTTVVDHHASPSCIDGSLDLIAEALDEVGLRGVLSYEVSERGGVAEARAGVRENERFLQRVASRAWPRLRGLVGAHAAFTLSDATATALGELVARYRSSIHIHLAEDGIDATKGDRSSTAWLAERGLLGPGALVAHAVHVDETDARHLNELGAYVVHNPRSNANNAVGYARPARFTHLLLGTDGIGADMRAELQAASLFMREHQDTADLLAALARNGQFAGEVFGAPIGSLAVGAVADLVVLDYRAPTPLDEQNLDGHLLYGLPSAAVRHVVIDGRLVWKEGRSLFVDEERIYAQARAAAERLWRRM